MRLVESSKVVLREFYLSRLILCCRIRIFSEETRDICLQILVENYNANGPDRCR